MVVKIAERIYRFLFIDHDIVFYRICFAALIPCALFHTFCHVWMFFMTVVLQLVIYAHEKGWNRL